MTEPLAQRLAEELSQGRRQLAEMELLADQTDGEVARHQQRYEEALRRVAPDDAWRAVLDQSDRLATMRAQAAVLAGKREALSRLVRLLEGLEATLPREPSPDEFRRGLARAIHDGPAQLAANIGLQAEIVERLLPGESAARAEVVALKRMAKQTLDATKQLIFEIHPMILDDLGLVPTLRRSLAILHQERPFRVELEVRGSEFRLPWEVETALFRLLASALDHLRLPAGATAELHVDWREPSVYVSLHPREGWDPTARDAVREEFGRLVADRWVRGVEPELQEIDGSPALRVRARAA